ncbi:4Fe-4S binding protein [Clostridium sp. 19966]|uniref:ATP-binding protein n=1 Tax=Clostridium sp. 19966 TaxID=2768166 RepID=UPI0028E07511|nr:4Fe-4S binding protein [Clostridium sp. 19966]MDT8717973.1 4Fe-4S binding protein [Clostridium sp. 19966]
MIRKIVEIKEEKCNGCGLCAKACLEGAIKIIDGKAKLISDEYCDGLGNCLPECPTGAISIIEREAVDFDEEAVEELKKENTNEPITMACGCPGSAAKTIERKKVNFSLKKEGQEPAERMSELRQWPVQLNLINSRAPYLQGANLLVAADCTAYAYANFHEDFIRDHITVIGCPKLDDVGYYKEKLTDIIANSNLKSITVVRMEVPCCGGIVNAVKTAMLQAQIIVPYREVTISTDGSII